jgi:hypothetical protein
MSLCLSCTLAHSCVTLVLTQALNITTHVLRPGGTFVAKVRAKRIRLASLYTPASDALLLLAMLAIDFPRQRRLAVVLTTENLLPVCYLQQTSQQQKFLNR